MICFLNIHSIFVSLSHIKVTSILMKKYVKTLLVTGSLILCISVLIAQEKSDTPETLIKIETTQGNMVVKLYNETPGHRDNLGRRSDVPGRARPEDHQAEVISFSAARGNRWAETVRWRSGASAGGPDRTA